MRDGFAESAKFGFPCLGGAGAGCRVHEVGAGAGVYRAACAAVSRLCGVPGRTISHRNSNPVRFSGFGNSRTAKDLPIFSIPASRFVRFARSIASESAWM